MRVAIEDLGLQHLWIVNPGPHQYPIDECISVVPLARLRDALAEAMDLDEQDGT
jgi:hypothetical protein